jgi:hypothetical protein
MSKHPEIPKDMPHANDCVRPNFRIKWIDTNLDSS